MLVPLCGVLAFDITETNTVQVNAIVLPVVTPPSGGGGGGGGGGGYYAPINSCPSGTTGTYPACIPAVSTNNGKGLTFKDIVKATPQGKAPYRADPFPDHKIDILDFNVLMVNWNKKAGDGTNYCGKDKNIADINCDGVVNILDFNILMVYWGKTY